MIFTKTSFGTLFFATILAGLFKLGGAVTEPQFMTVESMSFHDGRVYVTSQINANYVIADWQVAVVSSEAEAPSCSTKKGPNLHEGWSAYKVRPMSSVDFSLDVWVNDVGCLERLIASGYTEYKMFVTWTPRDGSEPVTAKTEFELDG